MSKIAFHFFYITGLNPITKRSYLLVERISVVVSRSVVIFNDQVKDLKQEKLVLVRRNLSNL